MCYSTVKYALFFKISGVFRVNNTVFFNDFVFTEFCFNAYRHNDVTTGIVHHYIAYMREGCCQITAGKEQKFAYTLSIEGNSLVQDKSQLSVVTLLIDNATGIIMNATQTKIEAPEANSINSITSSPNQPVKYYNLQGQEVGDDYRGIVVTKGRKMLRR